MSERKPQLYLIKTEGGVQVVFATSPPVIKPTSNDTNSSETKIEASTRLSSNSGVCSLCGKFVKYLKQHLKFQHQGVKRGDRGLSGLCPVCGKFFKYVAYHVSKSHQEEFPCDQCCAIFKSQDVLDEHRQTHYSDHYKCDNCTMVFKTLTDLAIHNHCHSNTYSCPKCNLVCKTRQSLKYHVKKEEENFNYHCHICGRGFLQQHLLQCHIERHENIKKHECEICHKKFTLKTYLKNHLKFNHKKELFGIEEVFQCEMCARKFSFECSLKRHLNLVHKVGEERSVTCQVCNKVLTTTYSLKVHMRLHTGEKKYHCIVCGEGFARNQYVTRHMARRHGATKDDKSNAELSNAELSSAELSNAESSVFAELVDSKPIVKIAPKTKKHIQRKRTADPKIKELMGRKTNATLSRTKVRQKIIKKKQQETWSSDEDTWNSTKIHKENGSKTSRKPRKCKENAKEKSVLEKLSIKLNEELQLKSESEWSDIDPDWAGNKMDADDEIQQTGKKKSKEDKDQSGRSKQDKSGLCPQCGKVVSDIRSHIKSHTNVFSCDLCFINFKNEKQLNEHKDVHESENPYNCDKCNLIFKNVTKLALHRFLHTGSYTCPICGFIATSKFRNSIIAHIKRHEDNYAVRCEICNKGFLCKKKLEEHIEWHENIPKYECEICHKKFPVKSYLQLHSKFNHKKELYGTEEIFQCELCGRNFTFEKSFKRHLSCIHKVGKDFTVKCHVCGKLIANNHNLKKHMRVHTGEKNFSCDVCGKTFSQKQYVTRHQKVHQADREGKKRSGEDPPPYKIEPLV